MLARTPLAKQCEVGKQIVTDQSNSFVQALHGLMVMDFLLEKGLTQNWDIFVVAIADTASLYCSNTFGHEVEAPMCC